MDDHYYERSAPSSTKKIKGTSCIPSTMFHTSKTDHKKSSAGENHYMKSYSCDYQHTPSKSYPDTQLYSSDNHVPNGSAMAQSQHLPYRHGLMRNQISLGTSAASMMHLQQQRSVPSYATNMQYHGQGGHGTADNDDLSQKSDSLDTLSIRSESDPPRLCQSGVLQESQDKVLVRPQVHKPYVQQLSLQEGAWKDLSSPCSPLMYQSFTGSAMLSSSYAMSPEDHPWNGTEHHRTISATRSQVSPRSPHQMSRGGSTGSSGTHVSQNGLHPHRSSSSSTPQGVYVHQQTRSPLFSAMNPNSPGLYVDAPSSPYRHYLPGSQVQPPPLPLHQGQTATPPSVTRTHSYAPTRSSPYYGVNTAAPVEYCYSGMPTTTTPSPSDSGVHVSSSVAGDLETMVRRKELELVHLRQTMERNELAMTQAYEEKKTEWIKQISRERSSNGQLEAAIKAASQRAQQAESALHETREELAERTEELHACQSQLRIVQSQQDHVSPAHASNQLKTDQQSVTAAEVENLRDQLTAQTIEIEDERARWLEEKAKVIAFQKHLQLNYVQLNKKTQRLEAEVEQLTLDLERKDYELGEATGSTGNAQCGRRGQISEI